MAKQRKARSPDDHTTSASTTTHKPTINTMTANSISTSRPKSKAKQTTRKQRLRHVSLQKRAGAVLDRTITKTTASVRRHEGRKKRRREWDDINGDAVLALIQGGKKSSGTRKKERGGIIERGHKDGTDRMEEDVEEISGTSSRKNDGDDSEGESEDKDHDIGYDDMFDGDITTGDHPRSKSGKKKKRKQKAKENREGRDPLGAELGMGIQKLAVDTTEQDGNGQKRPINEDGSAVSTDKLFTARAENTESEKANQQDHSRDLNNDLDIGEVL